MRQIAFSSRFAGAASPLGGLRGDQRAGLGRGDMPAEEAAQIVARLIGIG